MKDRDKIAMRLTQIIVKLNDGAELSTGELAEEFNVVPRTIERDFERLGMLPIEIRGKGMGRRYKMAEYGLGRLSFNDIRNFATLLGQKRLFGKLDDGFISDILNAKLNSAFLIKHYGYEEPQISRDDFNALSASVLRHWQIQCVYNAKNRVLKPYKMINNNGIWYLLADDKGVLKNFALAKLSNLKFSEHEFTPKAEFLERIEQNDSNWFSDTNFIVTLCIKPEAIEYFRRKPILANMKILSDDEKGLVVETKVAYDDEILRIVKYWLPFIRIIKPLDLKKKFENLLEKYLDDEKKA
ncbi:MAG: WYL domain-containing protein [Campylobacter sp.]|nr:WYL domain-containing protein [Campylobacter sp.]